MAFKFNPITGNLDLVNAETVPGGLDGTIQYNNGGTFGGDSNLVFDDTNKRVGIQVSGPTAVLHVNSTVGSSPASPTPLTLSTSLVQWPNNPTISVTKIVGPDDSSGTGTPTATQVDGSGNYFSSGSVNNDYTVYAVIDVNGTYYYNGTPTIVSFSDSASFNNFEVSLSWSTVTTADGYVVACAGAANFSVYVGNVSSWFDDGNNSGYVALTDFTPVKYFYQAGPADSSGTAPVATENNSGGPYLADGSSSITYNVYGYSTYGGVNYYSGTAGTFSFSDSNTSSNFYVDLTWSDIGAAGYVVEVTGFNSAVGSISYIVDLGYALSYLDDNTGSGGSVPPNITTYAPIHYYRIRSGVLPSGLVQSWNPTFSSTNFTSSNEVNGYILRITSTITSTPINSNGIALLGTPSFDGTFNQNIVSFQTAGLSTTFYDQIDNWSGGSLNTQYGFLGDGSIRYYRIYGTLVQSGTTFYSNTPTNANITLPSDSQYYTINISWPVLPGVATFKILRSTNGTFGLVGTAALISTGTSATEFTNFGNSNFSASVTVTPDIVVPTTAIFRANTSALTDPCALRLESTAVSSANQRLEFGTATITSLRVGYNPTTGNAQTQSIGSNLEVQNISGTTQARIGLNTVFNSPLNSAATLEFFNGSGQPIIRISSNNNLITFGGNVVSGTQNAAALFWPTSASNSAAVFRATTSNQSTPVLLIQDSSGGFRALFDRLGGLRLGSSTLTSGVGLHISAATFSQGQLRLDSYAGDVGSPTNGDIWHSTQLNGLKTRLGNKTGYLKRTLVTNTNVRTVTNTTAESTSIPSTLIGDLSFSSFFAAGKIITIRMRGIYSVNSGSETLRIKVKLNAIVLVDSTAVTLPNHTDDYWEMDVMIVCATTGASGTVYASGAWKVDDPNQDAYEIHPLFNTGTVTVNTTVGQTLDVTAQWGAASASNKFTTQIFEVESSG